MLDDWLAGWLTGSLFAWLVKRSSLLLLLWFNLKDLKMKVLVIPAVIIVSWLLGAAGEMLMRVLHCSLGVVFWCLRVLFFMLASSLARLMYFPMLADSK